LNAYSPTPELEEPSKILSIRFISIPGFKADIKGIAGVVSPGIKKEA